MITQAGLLLSGLVDVRQRALRLLAGIEQAEEASGPGTRVLLRTFRHKFVADLTDRSMTVQGLLAGAYAIEPDADHWTSPSQERLAHAAIKGFDALVGQHDSLSVYLPGHREPREDLTYLLFRALDLSIMSRRHERVLSTHITGDVTWEASSRDTGSDLPAIALSVPWVESLTPLRWPLFVHELGHYLLPGNTSGADEVEQIADDHRWRTDRFAAFQEIVADAVAEHHFGDAYAFALAREGYLISYKRHVGALSVLDRLSLLDGPNDLKSNLPTVWNLGNRDDDQNGPPPTDAVPADVLQEMRAEAVALTGPAAQNNPSAVDIARDLMRAGEPAAARPSNTVDHDDIADIIHRRRADPAAVDHERVADVVASAQQVPLTDGEIYEAAWREACDRDTSTFAAALQGDADADSLMAEAHLLADHDTWLARSLQSAAVHRWIDTAKELAS